MPSQRRRLAAQLGPNTVALTTWRPPDHVYVLVDLEWKDLAGGGYLTDGLAIGDDGSIWTTVSWLDLKLEAGDTIRGYPLPPGWLPPFDQRDTALQYSWQAVIESAEEIGIVLPGSLEWDALSENLRYQT